MRQWRMAVLTALVGLAGVLWAGEAPDAVERGLEALDHFVEGGGQPAELIMGIVHGQHGEL